MRSVLYTVPYISCFYAEKRNHFSTCSASLNPSKGSVPFQGFDLKNHNPLNYPYEVIDSVEKLNAAVKSLRGATCVALDVEALCTKALTKRLGDISLIQACSDTSKVVYLFDALTLPRSEFRSSMEEIMTSKSIWKFFFDCRRDVEALHSQLNLVPQGVIDLQLYFTAWQWKLRSVYRRSSMGYVLKTVSGISRKETDSAVQTAMTLGDRPVWDVRPLPKHFLEYAASDVRDIMLMAPHLLSKAAKNVCFDHLERLSFCYVEHYAQLSAVEDELDPSPAEVSPELLERFVGPGGVCKFCGAPGHVESECFRRQSASLRCTFCGALGHSSRNCFKQHPQLLKCESCGQVGHNASNCFRKNPCKFCGGNHKTSSCHKRLQSKSFFPLEEAPK